MLYFKAYGSVLGESFNISAKKYCILFYNIEQLTSMNMEKNFRWEYDKIRWTVIKLGKNEYY